jgi:hypothetical protein
MLKSQENHDFEGPEYFFGPSMSNSELFILEKKMMLKKYSGKHTKGVASMSKLNPIFKRRSQRSWGRYENQGKMKDSTDSTDSTKEKPAKKWTEIIGKHFKQTKLYRSLLDFKQTGDVLQSNTTFNVR